MAELPEYMQTKDKPVVHEFAPAERLFRRVPHTLWDDDEIELDAIDFPDMSCTRESLAPPMAARWVGENDVDWGIIGFRVSDIPAEVPYQGAVRHRLRAEHAPLKRNYPHSEVRVYESPWDQPAIEIHLDKKQLPGVPREAQQVWREKLRRKSKIVLAPRQEPDEA